MNSEKFKSFLASCGILALFGVVIAGPIALAMSSDNGSTTTTTTTTKDDSAPKEAETRTMTETKIEYIDYTSSTVDDPSLEYGKTEVRTKGVKGEITTSYQVTYEGSKEVSREQIKKETTRQPVNEVIAKGTKIVWRCVDVTSYDRNPYNDNKCTNSLGETIYTYDSDAERLDPTYRAGTSGAPRYNF